MTAIEMAHSTDEIVDQVVAQFATFGTGAKTSVYGNPIAIALARKPPTFALGVDIREVVEFVLSAAAK